MNEGMSVKSAKQTRLEFAAPSVDIWVDSLRRWIADHLIKPLIARIDQCDCKLKAEGLVGLECTVSASGSDGAQHHGNTNPNV